MSGWIKTEHQLPKNGDNGLCCVHFRDDKTAALIVVPFSFMNGDFHPFAYDENLDNDDYWVDPLYWPVCWQLFPSPPTE